jgi:hypothetical protein
MLVYLELDIDFLSINDCFLGGERGEKEDDRIPSVLVWLMMFNTSFNNISVISWRSVLLVEETEYPEKTTHQSVLDFSFNFSCDRINIK